MSILISEMKNGIRVFGTGFALILSISACADTANQISEKPAAPQKSVNALGTSPRPIGQPETWAALEHYPAESLRNKNEGLVTFRIIVEPNGKPGSCMITGSSGYSDLDAAACTNIMRHGEFYPATDADGQAIRGVWSGKFRWALPDDAN